MGGTDRTHEIAIVGGGASGALVAAHLLRRVTDARITLVEPRPNLGHGLAYSTQFQQHLLNVPAGNMSAFPDRPTHFVDWLRANGRPDTGPHSFAPRQSYGRYVEGLLQGSINARDPGSFRHIRAEARDIGASEDGAAITLSDGWTVKAQKVVVAVGNPASASLSCEWTRAMGEQWHVSPWIGDALRVRFAGERILLIGSGLTAVDSALALHAGPLPCEVTMISRRGVLPQVHDLRRTPTEPPVFRNSRSVRRMLHQLRVDIGKERSAGGCWRSVIDSLRRGSNHLWSELPVAEQKRFLRHLKPYWESHRHRMAPEVAASLAELQKRGAVALIAGRVQETFAAPNGMRVRVAQRFRADVVLEVDRGIDCTGIHEDYRKPPRRFLRSLMESGLASANELGLGFRTNEHGALIDARGQASTVLYTLGPPRRGDLFETTAMPEIRCQADALAKHLIGELHR